MELPRMTPEPDEAERQAILAALAAEEAETGTRSGWAEALLPTRSPEEDEA